MGKNSIVPEQIHSFGGGLSGNSNSVLNPPEETVLAIRMGTSAALGSSRRCSVRKSRNVMIAGLVTYPANTR